MTTFTFKKYRSFILSCLLHALLLLVLLYTRIYQNSPEQLIRTTRIPAKVQMQNIPQLPFQPPASDNQPTLDDTAESKPVQQEEAHPEQMSEENAKSEILEKKESTFQEQLPQKEAPKNVSEKTSMQPFSRNDYLSASPYQSKNVQHGTSVSREAFMQAFSSAIQHGKVYPTAKSSQDAYSGPAHVQERLQEWGQHHYKEKLFKALRKASVHTSTHIYNERSLKKRILITITITKDGMLGKINKNDLSGIQEVDNHIIRILESADFPPIPDRYGTDSFVFSLPIEINLQPGSGAYRLFV